LVLISTTCLRSICTQPLILAWKRLSAVPALAWRFVEVLRLSTKNFVGHVIGSGKKPTDGVIAKPIGGIENCIRKAKQSTTSPETRVARGSQIPTQSDPSATARDERLPRKGQHSPEILMKMKRP